MVKKAAPSPTTTAKLQSSQCGMFAGNRSAWETPDFVEMIQRLPGGKCEKTSQRLVDATFVQHSVLK
jgi:hypothetical protein